MAKVALIKAVKNYTFTGPSTGTVGGGSTYTVTLGLGKLTSSATITFHVTGVGGSFSPSTVTLTNTSRSATTTFTPSGAGVSTLSVTNNVRLTNPAPLTTTAAGGTATAYTLTGPTTGIGGVVSTDFTVTLATGTMTGTTVITPSDAGHGGTFSPPAVFLTNVLRTDTFTYTPGTAGTFSLGTVNDGGLTNPAGISFTTTDPVTTYTLTGPSTGTENFTSTAFLITLGPGALISTTTFTPSDGGAGGAFAPTTLALTNSTRTGTFTYTPASSGAIVLSATNNGGLTNPLTFSFVSVAEVSAYTLTGSATGTTGVAYTFAVALSNNNPLSRTVIVTPNDGGAGGAFLPTFVSLSNTIRSATFTYTPSAAGVDTISTTNNYILTDPSPLTFTVSAPGVTTYTLSGPSTCTVGVPSDPFTIALVGTGTITGFVTISPFDHFGNGTFNPGAGAFQLTNTVRSGTITYTAVSADTFLITTTNNGGLTDPAPLNITATTSAATAYTLTGPTSGTVGQPSGPFTVTLGTGSQVGTVIFTPDDAAGGGTFSPTTVSLTNTTRSATFTYNSANTSPHSITTTNNGGLSDPGGVTFTGSTSAATTYTMTGPTTGRVGSPSGPFTVTMSPGSVSGAVIVTPHDASGGGTFAPTTVSLTNTVRSATFTYNAANTSSHSITVTNNGGLSNPSPITFVATTSSVITIDAAWLIANGPAPYYLTQANTVYQLTSDVTATGTAFLVLDQNITFDLNGHTITYDNNTAPGVPNGGFETGTPGSAPPNWDVSGAPGAVIKTVATAAWKTGWWGNQLLEIPNVAGGTTVTIVSDSIAIPLANVEYCAYIQPKMLHSGGTCIISVIDQTTLLAIPSIYGPPGSAGNYGDGGCFDPNRGTLCAIQFVPTTTHSVKLKVQITPSSGPATIDLDHADLTRSRDYGVIATPSTYYLPAFLQTPTVNNHGTVSGVTIKNGTIVGGTGRSYSGNVIDLRSIVGATIDGVTMTSNNQSSSMIECLFAGNITVNNCSFTGNMDIIDDRMLVYCAIRLFDTYGTMSITGNTMRGHLQDGIGIISNYGTGPFVSVNISNNDIRVDSYWTDSYGIGIGSVANMTISGNTVIPINGRGLFIDGKIQLPSGAYLPTTGTVHDNHFEAIERPNLEYDYTGIEPTALMIRNGAVHNVTLTNNEFWGFTGIGLSWACLGGRIEAVNGQVPGGADYTGVNTNANLFFTGNQFKAILTAPDPSYTGIYQSQAWGMSVNNVFAGTGLMFQGNTIESNVTSLALCDNYGVIANDITFVTNTIVKNTSEGTNPPSQRTYQSITAGDWGGLVNNIRLIDMRYTNSAPSSPYGGLNFLGNPAKDVELGWIMTVHVTDSAVASSGATVTISDKGGSVFVGTTDSSGNVVANLLTDILTGTSSIADNNRSPFSVSVVKGPKVGSQSSITLTANTTINIAIV